MNDVIHTILERRSIRVFENTPIPEADLELILTCAQWAPSGSNQQPWHFLVIRNTHKIAALAGVINSCYETFHARITDETVKQKIMGYKNFFDVVKTAPVVIGVLGKPYESFLQKILKDDAALLAGNRIEVYPGSLSIGAAVENMLLAAYSLGYGSCWMTGPLMFQKELETFLEVASPWHLVSLVPLGKSAQKIDKKPARFPLNQICTFIDKV